MQCKDRGAAGIFLKVVFIELVENTVVHAPEFRGQRTALRGATVRESLYDFGKATGCSILKK